MNFIRQLRVEIKNSTDYHGMFWMVIGGFSFASMGALTFALGKQCDWMLIALFRMLLSFVLASYLAARATIMPFLFNRPLLWLRSLMGSAAMLCTFYALTHLAISDVAVITETRPILVTLIAGRLIGERSSGRLWVILALSMFGVILLEQPYFSSRNFAVFFALLAAFAGAVVMICLRLLRDIDPRVIVTHFSGTATLIAFSSLVLFKNDIDLSVLGNFKILIMLLGVGVLGTMGQLGMTKAFALDKAPRIAAAGYIKVGFAASYDLIFWQHSFKKSTLVGIALIMVSTTWLFYTQRSAKPKSGIPENTSSF
jgi:drug/metabolite transporter (DMT)-like permease